MLDTHRPIYSIEKQVEKQQYTQTNLVNIWRFFLLGYFVVLQTELLHGEEPARQGEYDEMMRSDRDSWQGFLFSFWTGGGDGPNP